SFDSTVIKVTAAIEDDLLDAFRDRTLRDRLADASSRIKITASVAAQIFFSGRRGNECLTDAIVDHLRVNVVQAAIDREPRALRVALYLAANPLVNRASNFCSISVCHLALPVFRAYFPVLPGFNLIGTFA